MSSSMSAISETLRSPATKLVLICILIVLLLVPLLMVMGLVAERAGRAQSVRNEISRYWGGPQHITGPFLVVPYLVRTEAIQGDKRIEQTVERKAIFLPDELSIGGKSRAEVLHRSIYDVNVYTSGLTLEGRFLTPDMAEVDPNAFSVRWNDAFISLAVGGITGLKDSVVLELDGTRKVPFSPSIGLAASNQNGIHARLAEASAAASSAGEPLRPFSFRIALSITGSSSLMFAPGARETRVALQSDWPHPSFSGAFLPAERKVSASGFEASWKVPHLARSVPNAWSLGDGGFERLSPYLFGVDFYAPVDFYDLVSRAVKYAVLFLALGFMGVFVLELLSEKRVHPVQYLFTGIAMVFFYVLLLSLCEHIGFGMAYLAASVATGGMLSLYVGKALSSRTSGALMLLLFLAVYGFLYFVLQLEDYALLAGALLGFAALSAVMFSTLHIDWSRGMTGSGRADEGDLTSEPV